MSNKMKLFLLGCAPLMFGVIVKMLRSTLGIYGSEVFIFGAVFSGCWCYVGYRYNKLSNYLNSVILVHLIGLFCLSITNLLLVSSSSFPLNILVYLVESYYLPMYLFTSAFMTYSGVFNLYLYSFIMMVILFSIGFKIGYKETR